MPSDSFEPQPSDQTDTELFHALKTGQIAALGILYDRYAAAVYGLARRILGNTEEAEDVTQEVFLTLHHRDTYDPSRGSLLNFLLTMTRSRSIDRLRSRSIKQRFFQRWRMSMSAAELSPLSRASSNEQAKAVRQAMMQLRETERQVLELAYYRGLSQSEIAERLNIPLGTVKSRSRQGLKKLRRTLQELI